MYSYYHRGEAYYHSANDYALERLLQDVHPNLEIIERLDYLAMMLPFEVITTNNLMEYSCGGPLFDSTHLYGKRVWMDFTGDRVAAADIRKQILSVNNWSYFVYIAAEVHSSELLTN